MKATLSIKKYKDKKHSRKKGEATRQNIQKHFE